MQIIQSQAKIYLCSIKFMLKGTIGVNYQEITKLTVKEHQEMEQ